MNKLKALHKYSAAITFLAFEFFALMAFNFSGSFVLFGSLTLALSVLLVIFNIKEIKLNGLSNVALFFIPLVLFVLLTTVGNYMVAHTKVGDFSWAELVFIPLGILPMAFIGYLLSIDKHFKIRTFINVIYFALAAYVLVNFIYNMVQFGAFYPIFYKGYYLYYMGLRSEYPVNEFAYTLEGFKFIEAKMGHYVLYPLLLLTSSISLIYLSPRKQKVLFISYASFTLIALLSLILVPSILSLAGLAVVGVLVLIMFFAKTFPKTRKVFKIIMIVVLILALLVYLVFILNKQSFAGGISSLIANNGLLNRLFNTNHISQEYIPVVEDIFSAERFLGFVVTEDYVGHYVAIHLSGGFAFDSYMTSGVIGALALFIFIYFGFKTFKKYFHSHKDEFIYQATMLLFLIVFVGYSTLFNTAEYALFYDIYRPIYMTVPFMIMVFMFSYVYCKTNELVPEKKKEEVKEEISNETI